MKITAFVVILCISVLTWYNYPDPPPALSNEPPPPISEPAVTEDAAGPVRVVAKPNNCAKYEASEAWYELQKIYPDMSADELCEFVMAPNSANIDRHAADLDTAWDFINRILSEADESNDHMAEVPDLRYYLDPQAIEAMRQLSISELIDKVNIERSAEAAYWLAHHYLNDEQTYLKLMLSAASYAQKPGPLLNAINGCCAYTPGDLLAKREADIKREALIMIARETNLPEATDWPEVELDADIEAEVLAQRATYVEELNVFSVQAVGEEWVK